MYASAWHQFNVEVSLDFLGDPTKVSKAPTFYGGKWDEEVAADNASLSASRHQSEDEEPQERGFKGCRGI